MFAQRCSVLALERPLPWNKLYTSVSLYFLFPFLSALCLLISRVLLSVTRKSISAHHLVSVPKMHQKKRNKERAGLSEEVWLGIQRCICCRSAFDCDLDKKRRDTCSEFHLILQLSWTLLCSPYIYIYTYTYETVGYKTIIRWCSCATHQMLIDNALKSQF